MIAGFAGVVACLIKSSTRLFCEHVKVSRVSRDTHVITHRGSFPGGYGRLYLA